MTNKEKLKQAEQYLQKANDLIDSVIDDLNDEDKDEDEDSEDQPDDNDEKVETLEEIKGNLEEHQSTLSTLL